MLAGVVVLVTAAFAALAPAVRAEPVLTLGTAATPVPSAVTDAAGTLHVIWRNVIPFDDPVMYCRVPAGGSGCTPVEISDEGSASPRLLLRPQDGALVALVPRRGEADLWTQTSLDGGGTWSAPAPGATGIGSPQDAELTPDGAAIDVVTTDTNRTLFQRIPLGGREDRVAVVAGGTAFDSARVTHLADGRPVVTNEVVVNQVHTRVAAPGVDPTTTAAWADRRFRVLKGICPRVADSGPTGTWLLTRNCAADGNVLAVRLWRFGPGGFALARRVGALDRPQPQPIFGATPNSPVALDVDEAGRLHAVTVRSPDRCGGRNCLVYRRTDRGGFGPPVTYPVSQGNLPPRYVSVAANSGGSGWIVYLDVDTIKAVPLVTPPRGARVGSRRIGSRRVSIPDFYACAPPGGRFVQRLAVDGRRGRTRILSVRFTFDGGAPSRTDRRAPYRAVFTLPFATGTRHVAGATVRYRVGRSAVRTATVGRTFVMC